MVSSTTHILMFHVLEQPQFSVGALGVDDGLERSRQLLHSDLQARPYVIRRAAEKNTSSPLQIRTSKQFVQRTEDCVFTLEGQRQKMSHVQKVEFSKLLRTVHSGSWRTYGKIF